MESIYYVTTWLCHRTCPHCYDDRFRPYHGSDLAPVVEQSRTNFARIIGNFPPTMIYRDAAGQSHPGRVILAGGEVLLEAIRESVLYPALRLLRQRYGDGIRPVVQTTGDLLTARIVNELKECGVWLVSVSGMDDHHEGLDDPARRAALIAKDTALFAEAGFLAYDAAAQGDGPYYQFFGATPEAWIGRLWPRGRAWSNSLSSATLEDNFCDRWSGGRGFLEAGNAGAEVSVDPSGDVFPCCLKTRRPVGNLLTTPLPEILARLRGNPVYEAINAGAPQRMGLAHGWSEADFRERSRTTLPNGQSYQNLCVGCDRFHDEMLSPLVRLG
ncbi:MAG: radical SAM protein [Bryobacteraceae bacterium]|nr:radical SAM protein [Bryobacteraceae bacterium]